MAKGKRLIIYVGLIILWSSSGLFPLLGTGEVSANPEKLKWSIVDTPSDEGNVVVTPSEINAVVIASSEIFYALDIPHKKIYKSIDSGFTWDDKLSQSLEDAGASLPVWGIAVAPDAPNLLAVVTDNRKEVYVSDDGGQNWEKAAVPDIGAMLIADITISPHYDGNHDVAIGTRNPDGSANGDVWVIKLGGFASWKAHGLNMDVSLVRFSPSYSSDTTILAVASNIDNTYLCTRHKVGDIWEDVIPAAEISVGIGNSPSESEIITADLALVRGYYSRDADWIVYAGYHSTTDADDAYRIKHEEGEESAKVSRLEIERGGKVSVSSIDYAGGKLLVGQVLAEASSASALIRICSNPEETFLNWKRPDEPPTGGAFSGRANARVVWGSGSKVYCGTSTNQVANAGEWADTSLPGAWSGNSVSEPDESAFSISTDKGDTWNQLSLIDTRINNLCDYAISSDYKTLYLASIGGGFDSIWRSVSEPLGKRWQRINCLDGEGKEIILKSSPEEDEEGIFFAIKDSYDARYSWDKGETWKSFWDCSHVTDLAVVSDKKFYVLDDKLLHKCGWNEEMWSGVWEWQTDIDTGLESAYTMVISGEKYIFVGGESEEGDEGKIAYSTDGGTTFEIIREPLPEPGKLQIMPDEEFGVNRIIYAASDDSSSQIYRWTIGGSTSWKELNAPNLSFHGIAQRGGVLYGAYGYGQGVARTLIPHLETVIESDWDNLTVGLADGVVFKPGSLKARSSDKIIELWAIDGNEYFNGVLDPDDPAYDPNMGRIWVYSDNYALYTPWPTSPAMEELIPVDPCTCQAKWFCFKWRELPLTEEYELWIALDEEFNLIILQEEGIRPDNLHDPAWCPLQDSLRFVCGKTYYWKVRSSKSEEGELIHSRWSPPMHFTVKIATLEGGDVYAAPILKAPQNGSRDVIRSPSFSWESLPHTTYYEFILAKDANLAQIIVKENLPTSAYHYSGELSWDTTYFWQVRAVQPVPSDTAIGTFTVRSQSQASQPPVVVKSASLPSTQTPLWIWAVIGILTLLNVVVITFCLVRR